MRTVFFGIFFVISALGFSQEQKVISGKISVPAGEQPVGVTVFNKNINKGVVSDELGNFSIKGSVNDTLVFSALQFQELMVVIDQKMIDSGKMSVELFLLTNQLAEVFLSDHNLSGNLSSDVGKVDLVIPDLPLYSAAELMEMNLTFPADSQSGVPNAALGEGVGMPPGGINILGLAGTAVNVISGFFPKRTEPVTYHNLTNVRDELTELFDEDFFVETLKIEKERINEFLYFVQEQGLSSLLLEEGKELDLIEFLLDMSKRFNDSGSSYQQDPRLNIFQPAFSSIAA